MGRAAGDSTQARPRRPLNRDGGLFDTTGTVQFRATYVQPGQRGVLAETSRFARQDRHWTYLGPIVRNLGSGRTW